MAKSPVVTGISPKEGPPGTRVTIRGEHLGINPNDLSSLKICDCECMLSAEWKSPNKIIARSGPGKGRGDIILVTKSGGVGTSTVQFRGYHETIGPLKESAVWVEEAPLNWGRQNSSVTIFQLDDPLGLSVEGDEKFPENELTELFPDGSGDLLSENFEPAWFLLEHHHGTSFDDLRVGLSYLKRKVDSQNEGQLSFLKDNVGSVMEQLDTLFTLKQNYEADFERNNETLFRVEEAINQSLKEATHLFHGVLTRREKAEATRNALAVMTRYKFLFQLPINIDRNIKNEDVDVIINDYARALNLFGKTEVSVFKKILEEVETKILNIRINLKSKLHQMPTTLKQQKKIIRNLVALNDNGDPGWEAIIHMKQFLIDKIKGSYQQFITEEQANETPNKNNRHPQNKHKRNISLSQQIEPQNIEPKKVLCIDEIATVISDYFPDLWKLGQNYFVGDLAVKPDCSHEMDFKEMILDIIVTVSDIYRTIMLPTTTTSSFSPVPIIWLPHCLKQIRSVFTVLTALDLPNEALNKISSVIFDLRLHCLNILFKQASEQIIQLKTTETWKLDYHSKQGTISQLPNDFYKIIMEAMNLAKEYVIRDERRETALVDNETAKNELQLLVHKCFWNFSQVLEQVGLNADTNCSSTTVMSLSGSSVTGFKLHNDLMWEQKLLITISNSQYTRNVMLLKFKKEFEDNGFPTIDVVVARAVELLENTESKLLETYIETKSDPLVGTIEPSMYVGSFEWDSPSLLDLREVRPYAKEIITNLIALHSEVQTIMPDLMYVVLSEIVVTISEEMSRLMNCVTHFSENGAMQARLDLMALTFTLSNYFTPNSKDFFCDATNAVPPLKSEDNEKYVLKCFEQFKTRMHLQIMCFLTPCPNDIETSII
ncbi:exocyst complex component 2 [Acyrthosiphon pisum]|uniref:Exocyst complex component 2 n=2 Tax=Macrosiphini TaxID=33386 RepID=A0A8R2B276_ACYPI|nr:exocyst complex component 2 [Acyrthosiphon pisum]|eukprot:XP_008180585.1 PREDICTED: exocyst complex component 2 [Acyrthosiphon pisum]